jgi:predicted nucleotidyltransferase
MLPYRTGTQIYLFFAKIIAQILSRFEPVTAVFGKRSLASGEIVFGKSDIDITILIKDFDSEKDEAYFLSKLYDIYLLTQKFFPILGECDIYNRFDIHTFYCLNTYNSVADRTWIKLYGSEIDPFPSEVRKEDIVFRFLWWFFSFLITCYRRNNFKGCFNVFTELVNCYCTYSGEFERPKLKRQYILDYLITVNPSCEKLKALKFAFNSRFRSNDYRFLTNWIYQQCLELANRLYDLIPYKLRGKVKAETIYSYSPPEFLPRKYIVIESLLEKKIISCLKIMKRDRQSILVTDKLLNLYFRYYNPWEYYTMLKSAQGIDLSEPSVEATQEYVLRRVNKVFPRYVPLSGKYDALFNMISQCRLFLDHGFISNSEIELHKTYRLHYGNWPFMKHKLHNSYFAYDYPKVIKIINEIHKSEYFSLVITAAKDLTQRNY